MPDAPSSDPGIGQLRSEIGRLQGELLKLTNCLTEAESAIQKLTGTDSLTGVLNRIGFERVLATEQGKRRAAGLDVSAILVNVDGFRQINKRMGFTGGDIVLQEVTRRLKGICRGTDRLARIGGDEFLILLPATGLDEAMRVAHRIESALSSVALDTSDSGENLKASVGVTRVPGTVLSVDEVLTSVEADLQDKRGRKSDRVPTEGADSLSKQILEDLSRGIGLRVFAQPIFDLHSDGIVGYELLARGPINTPYESPVEFFRLAMENDYLGPVDRACFQAGVDFVLSHLSGLRFHLNLFPATLIGLQPKLVLDLIPAAKRSQICIEINEQQIVGGPSYLFDVVEELRRGGIPIAIDDVGFGRSCLENLVVLEPEFVKVDRRLVLGVSKSERAAFEFTRLLNLVQSLGAQVVAEGVETPEDLGTLKRLRVPMAQGWIWGKPFPVEQIGASLDQESCGVV